MGKQVKYAGIQISNDSLQAPRTVSYNGSDLGEGYLPSSFDPNPSDVEDYLSNKQSTAAMLTNAVGKIIPNTLLQTVETLSYLGDWEQIGNQLQGEETEYTNWLADAMKSAKESVDAALPVYRTDEAQTGFAPGDASWWMSQTPDTVSSMLSLLAPALITGGAASAAGRAIGLGTRAGMTAEAALAAEGRLSTLANIPATAVSRHAESTMEAGNLFKETYNLALQQGMSDQEARQKAGLAAARTYNRNWIFAAQDFLALNTLTKGFNAATKGAKGPSLLDGLKTFAGVGVSEGAEEAGQFILSEEGKRSALEDVDYFGKGFSTRLQDYIDDPEFKASVLQGALGGLLMQGSSAIGSKEVREKAEEKGKQFKDYIQQKFDNLTGAAIRKEKANKEGNIGASLKEDQKIFTEAIGDHIAKGTLNTFKEKLDEQIKSDKADPEAKQNLRNLSEDVDFLITQQEKIKANPSIPKELQTGFLMSQLAQRTESRIADKLQNTLETGYQDLIKTKELDATYLPLKQAQVRMQAYEELVKTQPQFKPQLELATKLYNEQLAGINVELMKQLEPDFDLNKKLVTSQDNELKRTAFQLASTAEKLKQIKSDIVDYSTKEGIEKFKQQQAEAKINKESEAVLKNPNATKEEILQAAANTKNEQLKVELAKKHEELVNKDREKNLQDLEDAKKSWEAPQVQRIFDREAELQTKIAQLENIPGKKDKNLLNSLKAELRKLSPLANTFRKNREAQIAQLTTVISPDNYKEELKAYEDSKIGLEDHSKYLQSMFVRFFKALQTKTDTELYNLLEETKNLLKDNDRSFNQLTYDRLKGLDSIDENDVDTLKLIKNFNTKKLQAIEEEILKRELETKNQPFILEENTETGKYFIRQTQIEEAFKSNSVEDISEDGKVFTIRGKQYFNLYSDPLQAINRNSSGDIVSVTLTNELNRSVTFTTERIVDEVAFGIISQQVLKQAENVITEPSLTQEVIDQQNKAEKQRKEKELLTDLLEVQDTIDLLNVELIDTKNEFVQAGFKAAETNQWLKTTDKYKQLQELKAIEKIIQKELKQLNKIIPPKKVKPVKQKIQKNEPTTDTTTTAPEITERVTEQNNQGENQIVGKTTEEVTSTAKDSRLALLQQGAKAQSEENKSTQPKVVELELKQPLISEEEKKKLEVTNKALETAQNEETVSEKQIDQNDIDKALKAKERTERNGVSAKQAEYQPKFNESQEDQRKRRELEGQPLVIYKNYSKPNSPEATLYEMFATDEAGNLLSNTPVVGIGTEIRLRIREGIGWLQATKNNEDPTKRFNSKISNLDNVIIEGYAVINGEEKLVLELSNTDEYSLKTKNKTAQDPEIIFTKQLRQAVVQSYKAGQPYYTTKIVDKTIGDIRVEKEYKTLSDILEFDYTETESGWEYKKLDYEPVLTIIKANKLDEVPIQAALNSIPNEQTKTRLLNSPFEVTYGKLDKVLGGLVVLRTAANGTARPVLLKLRNLNQQEIDWVKNNLADLVNQGNPGLAALNKVVNSTELGRYDQKRSKGTIVYPAVVNGQTVDIVITPSEFKKQQAGQAFKVDIRNVEDGKFNNNITYTAEEGKFLVDVFNKHLSSLRRNAPREALNTGEFIDPVTNQKYTSFYQYLKQTGTATTNLKQYSESKSSTGTSKLSSYSVDNAIIYLDPKPEQVKIEDTSEGTVITVTPLPIDPNKENKPGTTISKPKKKISAKDVFSPKGKLKEATQPGYKTLTKEEVDWLTNKIGSDYVQVIKGIDQFTAQHGKKAYGMYHNFLIKLAEFAPEGTAKHEAIHFMLDLLPKAEREAILNEASKKFNINYNEKSVGKIEEKLAESFEPYKLNPNSTTGKIKSFFQKLWLSIKRLIGLGSEIEEFFWKVANEPLTKEQRNYIASRFGVESINASKFKLAGFDNFIQQKEAVDAFSYEVMEVARAEAKKSGIDLTSYFTNSDNIRKVFDVVKKKFTDDYNRIIQAGYDAFAESEEDQKKYFTYLSMGLGDTLFDTDHAESVGDYSNVPTEAGSVIEGFETKILRNLNKWGFTVKLYDGSLIGEEEENEDEVEQGSETTQGRNRDFVTDHTNLDLTKSMRAELKLWLSTLGEPVLDDDGTPVRKEDGTVEVQKTLFGTTKPINFRQVYDTIKHKTVGSEDPFTALQELSETNGIIKVVYDALVQERKSNPSLFNNAIMNFKMSGYVKQIGIATSKTRRMSAEERVEEDKLAKAENRTPNYEVVEVKVQSLNDNRTGPVVTQRNQWLAEAVNAKVINSLGEVENKSRQQFIAKEFAQFEKDVAATKDLNKIKSGMEAILYQFGVVDINKNVWKELLEQPYALNKLKDLALGTGSSLKRLVNDYVTNSKNPYDESNNIITTFAELQVKHAPVNSNDTYLGSDGKQQNPINLPSFITEFKDSSTEKSRRDKVLAYFKQDKFYYQNGKWANEFLLEFEKGNLDLRFLNLFNLDGDVLAFEDRGSKDSYLNRFTHFVNNTELSSKGYFMVGTPSDKTKAPAFLLPKVKDVDSAKAFMLKTFKNTLNSEIERIKLLKRNKGLVATDEQVNPTSIANLEKGDSFVYFEELNDLLPALTGSLTTGEVNITEFEQAYQEALNRLETIADEQYNLFLNDLVDKGLIEKKEVNGKTTLVDKELPLGLYRFDNKVKNPQQLENFLKTFFYQDSAWRLEMSKVFQGDYALYKNLDDYFKRQYQLVTPGYVGYSENPSKVNYFIFKKQERKAKTEFIERLTKLSNKETAEQYDDVNKTDAQAIMTPTGAKKLTGPIGGWTSSHELVYKEAWSKGITVRDAIKNYKGLDKEQYSKNMKAAAKVALEPLKPFVYVTKVIQTPSGETMTYKEQLKCSITLITPELETGRQGYRELSAYMKSNGTDIAFAEDAVKVGSYGVVDLNGSTETWAKLEPNQIRSLDVTDFRFPQILPSKERSEVSGSQLHKLILGDNATPQQVKKFNELWEQRIKDQNTDVQKDLGVDDTLLLSTDKKKQSTQMAKLWYKLQSKLVDKGLNENYEKAIQLTKDKTGYSVFNIPLNFPAYSTKFQEIISNFWTKKVMKLKTAGFSVVNFADFGIGFSDELEFMKQDKDGTVYSEIALYVDINQLGLKYGEHLTPTGDVMWDKLSKDQKQALEYILYRIPTSNKSSMLPVRVTKILPASHKGVAIIPGELTKQQGLDFDVDKSQLIQRVTKFEKGKPLSIDQEAIDTKLFDLYWETLQNKENVAQMLTPLTTVTLEAVVDRYDKLGLLNLDKKSKFFTPQVDVLVEAKNKDGKREIGINSRFNTAHAVLQTIKDYLVVNTGVNINIENSNVAFNKLGQLKDFNGKLISENFAETQQAALDAAKTPLLNLIGVIQKTMATYETMLGFGVSIEVASDFFMQPVIKEYTKYLQAGESSREAERSVLKAYPQLKSTFNKIKESKVNNFITDKTLQAGLTKSIVDNAVHSAAVLHEFTRLQKLAQQMTNINNALSLDTADKLNSIEALLALRNSVANATDEKQPIYLKEQLFDLETTPVEGKRLAAIYKYGVTNPLTYLGQFFPQEQNYRNLLSQTQQALGGVKFTNTDTINKVYKFFDYITLMHDSQFAKLFNSLYPVNTPSYKSRWSYFPADGEQQNSIYTYIQKFIHDLEKKGEINKAEQLKNNGLIKALEAREIRPNQVAEVGIRNTDSDKAKEDVTNGFEELLNASDPAVKTIALDLIQYAITTSGFAYGPSTFVDVIPASFWKDNGITDLWEMKVKDHVKDENAYILNLIRHKGLNLNELPSISAYGDNVVKSSVRKENYKVTEFRVTDEYAQEKDTQLPRFFKVNIGNGQTRLFESNPNDPTQYRVLQPLGARNFNEVRSINLDPGRQETTNPRYKDQTIGDKTYVSNWGKANPWKEVRKQYPLFDYNAQGENEFLNNYITETNTTPQEVLTKLLETSILPEEKVELQQMLNNVAKITSTVVVEDLVNKAGVYEINTTDGVTSSIIKINPNSVMNTDREMRRLLIHELNHAYFTGIIENPETEQEKSFVRNLERLRTETITKFGNIQGTENIHEFNAEVGANSEFRAKLQKTSLWDRFVRFIRNLFGQKDTYDQVLKDRYELINSIENLQKLDKVTEGEFAMTTEQYTKVNKPLKYKRELKTLEQRLESAKARIGSLRKQGRYTEADLAKADYKTLVKITKDGKLSKADRQILALTTSLKQDLKRLADLETVISKLSKDPANTNALVLNQSYLEKQSLENNAQVFSKNLEMFPEYFEEHGAKVEELKTIINTLRSGLDKQTVPLEKLMLEKVTYTAHKQNPLVPIEEIRDSMTLLLQDVNFLTSWLSSSNDVRDTLVSSISTLALKANQIADQKSNSMVYDTTTSEATLNLWQKDANTSVKIVYNKTGLNKALEDYQAYLGSKATKLSFRELFDPFLDQDSFKQGSNIKFVSPVSKEGKAILAIKEGSKDYPVKQFYTSYVLELLRAQETYPRSQRPGLNIPTILKGKLETVFSSESIAQAASNLKQNALRDLVRNGTEVEFKQADPSGDPVRNIPIRFASKTDGKEGRISKAEVSLDLPQTINLAIQYANQYDELKKVQADIELLVETAKHRKVMIAKQESLLEYTPVPKTILASGLPDTKSGVESNSARMADIAAKMKLYQEAKRDEGSFKAFGVNTNVRKVVDVVLKYTGLKMMFASVAIPVTNFSMEHLALVREAVGGNLISMKDYKAGISQAAKVALPAIKDLTNKVKQTEFGKFYLFMNPIGDHRPTTVSAIDSTWLRKTFDAITDTNVFEYQYTSQLMFAVLNKEKFKADHKGEKVSLYEALEIADNGQFRLKSGYTYRGSSEISVEQLNEVRDFITALYNSMNGPRNFHDRAQANYTAVGAMTTLMRSWLYPGIQARFNKKKVDSRLQTANEGFYVSSAIALQNMWNDKTGFMPKMIDVLKVLTYQSVSNPELLLTDLEQGLPQEEKDNLIALRQANLRKTIFDVYVVALLSFAIMMLSGDEDDDESYLLYMARRINREMLTFVNPLTAWEVIKTPTVALRTAEDISKFISASGRYTYSTLTGEEPKVLQSGAGKGYNELYWRAIGLTPIRQFYQLDPETIKNANRVYGIQ